MKKGLQRKWQSKRKIKGKHLISSLILPNVVGTTTKREHKKWVTTHEQ